ncbi:MAG: hypothetical protein R3F60_27205 [bacterium]
MVWPGGPGRILVAEDEGWTNGTHCVPQVDGRVVRVDCASGAEEVVVVRPGADFGNAALSPLGRSLYFTGAAGVERLDVRTLKVAGVTRRPERMCADALDEGAHVKVQERDVVVGFLPLSARLRILRGHACPGIDCSSGGWYGEPLDLDLQGARAVAQPASPLTGLARTSDGALWAAGGRDCDMSEDCGTGFVWRATAGDVFQRIAVPTRGTPRAIFADAHAPGALLVQAPRVGNGRADPWGGALVATRDGGLTWTEVPLPLGEDVPRNIELVGGHLDHLRIHQGYDGQAWETLDGGAHWRPASKPPMPTPEAKVVEAEGVRYEATWGGLLRTEGGQTRRVEVP